ncbi:lipopolysaccharide biosynthesis protein [Dyella amyloliquefaciens]|uniref:lipopolysaccharide biosynthesis protein n=1 Tax=Dyella amyloliquefaciens TaxID=1770545 RepID=UPI00102E9D0A|nr:oligosaccharide flippase family protein [Dyella amyloliquefaciens]
MIGQLARGGLLTTAVLGLRLVTQATSLILLTRLLGPQAYGHFASAAALAVVMGTLPSLGSGYVLLARASRDISAASDVWRYAWPLTAGFGSLLLALYVACGHWLAEGLVNWQILLLMGAAELLATPFTMLCSFALQASERVPLSQLVQWAPLALRVLAVLPCFAVPSSQRLLAYTTLQLLASMLGVLLGWVLTRHHVPLGWRPRRATQAELGQGGSYAAMLIVAANPSELDKIVAVRQVGAVDAGIYIAVSRVMGAIITPVLGLLLAAQPRLFRHADERSKEVRRLVRMLLALALGWGLLGGALLVAASPALPMVFGERYARMAWLMPWMAISAPLLSLRIAAGSVLVALGHPLERVGFELSGIALLVGGILVFTHLLGVLGLVAAVILAEAVMCAIGVIFVLRHLRQT